MFESIKNFFKEKEVDKFLIFDDENKTIKGLNDCIKMSIGDFNTIFLVLKFGDSEIKGNIYWNGLFIDPSIEPFSISIFDLIEIDKPIPNPSVLEAMNIHIWQIQI